MTSYPKKCPHCGRIVDSGDSVADTEAELRHHINIKHPTAPKQG